eukprot:c33533_g1_i1.p1 GENE.c33533_g1_i1~~c33533_g1_i1.p1  ORF type:complete len:233 (+),score=10.86 c33533_g1_i1:78-776(+)
MLDASSTPQPQAFENLHCYWEILFSGLGTSTNFYNYYLNKNENKQDFFYIGNKEEFTFSPSPLTRNYEKEMTSVKDNEIWIPEDHTDPAGFDALIKRGDKLCLLEFKWSYNPQEAGSWDKKEMAKKIGVIKGRIENNDFGVTDESKFILVFVLWWNKPNLIEFSEGDSVYEMSTALTRFINETTFSYKVGSEPAKSAKGFSGHVVFMFKNHAEYLYGESFKNLGVLNMKYIS